MGKRLLLITLISAALTGAGCQGTPSLSVSCPLALISGTLVVDGEGLALETSPGQIATVTWPDGVHAGRVDGVMSLIGFFGQTIAREGDYIEMGGGETGDDVFHGCGEIKVNNGAS